MFKFLILTVILFVTVESHKGNYKKRVLRMAEEGEFEMLNNMEEFEENEAPVMQMKETNRM